MNVTLALLVWDHVYSDVEHNPLGRHDDVMKFFTK